MLLKVMKALAGEVVMTTVPVLNVLAPFVAVLVNTAFDRTAATPPTIPTTRNDSKSFFYVASRPDSTMRQIAVRLGFTERTVFQLIKDLVASGMVRVTQAGRSKHYSVVREAHLPHPAVAHLTLGALLSAMERSTFSRSM